MNLRARIDLAVALAAVVASAGLGLLTWMDREDWRQHLPPRVLALLLIFLLLNRALHRLVRGLAGARLREEGGRFVDTW